MRRMALLAVFVAGCSQPEEPKALHRPAPSGEFTTLSYNVAGLPQEISRVQPKKHIPLISPLLNEYDLVLTQEDFDWWRPGLDKLDFVHYHARLREKTDHAFRSDRHPGPKAVGLDVATQRPSLMVGDGLGLLSRFGFSEFRRVPWTSFGEGAGDALAMKGFAMARIELAAGVTVDVYNLHGDAGGGPADVAARREGFEQLAAWIVEHSAGRAVILGGDTNLHSGRREEDAQIWKRFLERTGLAEVDPQGYIDKFAYRSGGGVELAPVSGAFESEKFRDEAGKPLSDHQALAVRWRWSAAGR